MADQAFRKSVEQLKMERTTAKRSFSRLCNSIMRTYRDMSEEELKESFNQLTMEAGKVMVTNDDVEARIIVELEAELDTDKAAVLTEQQKSDLEKFAKECELRLKVIKDLIQEALWTNFGNSELSIALQAAETGCEHAASAQPSGNKGAYDFMLKHLQGLVKTAKEVHGLWKRWIPPDYHKDIQSHLKVLELCIPKLISQKADFIQARIKEVAGRLTPTPTVGAFIFPMPTIKLRLTALPKFTSNRREFHRWKKDWEALQRQDKPTGSREVKKIQLLDSLDDKITRDFHLSTYNCR